MLHPSLPDYYNIMMANNIISDYEKHDHTLVFHLMYIKQHEKNQYLQIQGCWAPLTSLSINLTYASISNILNTVFILF